MQVDQSIYILKPEAVTYSKEIQKLISGSGLQIIKTRQIFLSGEVIEDIYYDCPKEIIEATKHFLLNNICEVGLVTGQDSIACLVNICGNETNPSECKKGTVRNLYGIHNPNSYQGTTYFQNAIHRPKNKQEAEKDIELLKQYFI